MMEDKNQESLRKDPREALQDEAETYTPNTMRRDMAEKSLAKQRTKSNNKGNLPTIH